MISLKEHLIKKHISNVSSKMDDDENIKLFKKIIKTSDIGLPKLDDDDYNKCYKVQYTFGKDNKGYYFETESAWSIICGRSGYLQFTSFEEHLLNTITLYNKREHTNCPIFRWRNHKGRISIADNMSSFNSLAGLPNNITYLYISEGVAIRSKQIDCQDKKIDTIELYNVGPITLSGTPTVDKITWDGWNGKRPATTFHCGKMIKK